MHARESIFLNFHEIRAILRQLTSGRRHISLCYIDICLPRVIVSRSHSNALHCQNSIAKLPPILSLIAFKYYNSSNTKRILLIFNLSNFIWFPNLIKSYRFVKISLSIFSFPRENYASIDFLNFFCAKKKKKIDSRWLLLSSTFNKSLFKLAKLRVARQHFSYFKRCNLSLSERITRARGAKFRITL